MRISQRIGAGYGLVILLMVACAAAGWIGLGKVSGRIDYITTSAWEAADGAMESSIEIEAQIIVARNILAGADPEAEGARLAAAREATAGAMERLEESGLLPEDLVGALREQYTTTSASLDELLEVHGRFVDAKAELDRHTAAFVALSDEVEERGDSAVETLEGAPDVEHSWDSGLDRIWSIADGGMESNIEFLKRLYQVARLESRSVTPAEARVAIAEAQAGQRETAEETLATGWFAERSETPGFEGQTMEAAYRDMLAADERVVGAFVDAFEAHEVSLDRFEADAQELLERLAVVEERADGTVESEVANVAGVQASARRIIGASLFVGMLIAVTVSVLLTRSIVRPVREGVEIIQHMANGDLTARPSADGKDELAEMSRSLGATLESLRSVLACEHVDWDDVAESRAVVQRYRPMVECASSPMVFANPRGKVAYVNPAGSKAARGLGLGTTKLEGANLRDLLPIRASVDLADPDSLPYREVVRVGRDSLDLTIAALHDEAGRYLGPMATWECITEKLEAERREAERLEAERREAEQVALRAERVLESVSMLAEGDLRRPEVLEGEDACGRISQGLVRLSGNLADSLSDIAENSRTLASASTQLLAMSRELGGSAGDASTRADTVVGSSNEVALVVESVAAATEELSVSVRETASHAVEAARFASNAVTLAHTTQERVRELGESSREIGEVVKMISAVASQTNLLALNATIEAARAGETGRGFAVVANEVKTLAGETSAATSTIAARIDAIQASTDGVTGAIEEISEMIQRISEVQTSIASATEEQSATAAEMSRHVSRAAKGTASITSSMESVATAVHAANRSASEADSAASDLSRMAERLAALVGRFQF